MIYGLYSMRDTKTGFMAPSLDASDDAAIRNFYHAVATSDGILFTYSADFSLWHLADFDADSGKILPVVPIVQIADGANALAAVKKEAARDAR